MQKLTSVLIVANRTATDRMLLEKAVSLARHVGAQIHLFSCDAELARLLCHSYPLEEAERARKISLADHLNYLRKLQVTVFAPDVQISVDAACHSPFHMGILGKIREIRPDLVMKAPESEHPLRRLVFDSNDWKLAKVCPTTLMLVRPHPWRINPKLAALVDVSENARQFAQTIVHTAQYFSLGCQGELDVVYSESSADEREKSDRLDGLERLVREYHVEPAHVHVLTGNPDEVLPRFAAGRDYDAVVLGALTHRRGVAKIGEMLTSRIADAVDCDLILIARDDPDLVVSGQSCVVRCDELKVLHARAET